MNEIYSHLQAHKVDIIRCYSSYFTAKEFLAVLEQIQALIEAGRYYIVLNCEEIRSLGFFKEWVSETVTVSWQHLREVAMLHGGDIVIAGLNETGKLAFPEPEYHHERGMYHAIASFIG